MRTRGVLDEITLLLLSRSSVTGCHSLVSEPSCCKLLLSFLLTNLPLALNSFLMLTFVLARPYQPSELIMFLNKN